MHHAVITGPWWFRCDFQSEVVVHYYYYWCHIKPHIQDELSSVTSYVATVFLVVSPCEWFVIICPVAWELCMYVCWDVFSASIRGTQISVFLTFYWGCQRRAHRGATVNMTYWQPPFIWFKWACKFHLFSLMWSFNFRWTMVFNSR